MDLYEVEFVLEAKMGDEGWVERGQYTDRVQAEEHMDRETGLTGRPHQIVRREIIGRTNGRG